jgi:hypothetical protein
VQRELEVLRASAGVDEASVRFAVDASEARIEFALATELAALPPHADIRPVEPISFTYDRVDDIGLGPPRQVLSRREDFPRNLGHLNPVRAEAPASLCLAVAGLARLYDRFGLEGVLERLRTFLRDAKIGALMQDGWEPVPYGDTSVLRPGSLDARFFQELAAAKPEGGVAYGVARLVDGFAVILPGAIDLSNLSRGIEAQRLDDHERHKKQEKNETLWIFVWPPATSATSDPAFGEWTTYGDVAAGLDALGLKKPYESAFGQALTSDPKRRSLPIAVASLGSRKTVVIIIGVWRPLPIRESIRRTTKHANSKCDPTALKGRFPKSHFSRSTKPRRLSGTPSPRRSFSGLSRACPFQPK